MVQTLIKLVPHKVKWMVKFVQKWNLTPENLAREGCRHGKNVLQKSLPKLIRLDFQETQTDF